MLHTIYNDCIDIIRDLAGNDYLYFDSAVEVKVTPHTYPFAAWAVCVSPADDIYVMDTNEEWHQVELKDGNASLIIASLYQRLQLMRTQYAKAS